MQFRTLSAIASVCGIVQTVAFLLVPFLAKLYAADFRTSSWKTWFRILSALYYLFAGGFALFAATRDRFLKATVGVGLAVFTVLFGLNAAAVIVAGDSTLKEAVLESTGLACAVRTTQTAQDGMSQWSCLMYQCGLALLLCSLSCSAYLSLVQITPTYIVPVTSTSLVVQSDPKPQFHDIDTNRPDANRTQANSPPVLELFRKTNKAKGDESDVRKSFEVVDIPPTFPPTSSSRRSAAMHVEDLEQRPQGQNKPEGKRNSELKKPVGRDPQKYAQKPPGINEVRVKRDGERSVNVPYE